MPPNERLPWERWEHDEWSGGEQARDSDEPPAPQPRLRVRPERPFAGTVVESLPPSRSAPRRRALIATCAALLVVVILGAVIAAAHAIGGAGPSRAAQSGGKLPSGNAARMTPGSGSAAPTLQLPPAGIPRYFSFGVMNAPGDVTLLNDMRAHNGTAWDFRYQYLAGGVNTGQGWETWNSPTGAFASFYMQESASNHYIPAFVYYEMLQSNGSCADCPEADKDLSNLNNPTVMGAYFANWRLLMKEIGSFGRPVLVIVEPDLWGYIQRAALPKGNAPVAVPASIASANDPDTSAFPNNAQGYAWALLHIRDLYAPNAVLALHVSNWSTGEDIGSNTDPNVDVSRVAQLTAQFLSGAGLRGNPAGVSSWDVLSNDVADRDSGQGSPWWDRTNQQFPNFSRYLSFISDITRLTGKQVVMWQVPEGNQYFDTENNSPHHTQDNRAEYILGHVADFARAGVIGVLFGPGNGGTSIDDAAHDGITRPAPIASFQCGACNNHVSSYPDDDGGYLRLAVGAYYRHGPLLLTNPDTWTPAGVPGASATVTPLPRGACAGPPVASVGSTMATPDPAHPGQTVTFSAVVTVNCNTTALIDIEVYGANIRLMQVIKDNVRFTAENAQTITIPGVIPAHATLGPYIIKVGVFAAGWGTQYAWNDTAGSLVLQ